MRPSISRVLAFLLIAAVWGVAQFTPSSLINISQWGGVATSLGQKLMASSVPVTLASNQSSLAVTPAANSSVNLAQVAGTNALNGGVAGSQGIGGLSAVGAAPTGNPLPQGVKDSAGNMIVPDYCTSKATVSGATLITGNTQLGRRLRVYRNPGVQGLFYDRHLDDVPTCHRDRRDVYEFDGRDGRLFGSGRGTLWCDRRVPERPIDNNRRENLVRGLERRGYDHGRNHDSLLTAMTPKQARLSFFLLCAAALYASGIIPALIVPNGGTPSSSNQVSSFTASGNTVVSNEIGGIVLNPGDFINVNTNQTTTQMAWCVIAEYP